MAGLPGGLVREPDQGEPWPSGARVANGREQGLDGVGTRKQKEMDMPDKETHTEMDMPDEAGRAYDVVIVGGGPAGLTAALSLAHCRRSVLVVDAGEQRNLASHGVHNYLGLEGVAPHELLRRGRAEAREAGAALRDGHVAAIQRCATGFAVALEDGATVTASRVILATGLVDVLPDVEHLPEFYGTSVFHCPFCDGATVDDRRVVVLSWGDRAEGFTHELCAWTRRLTLVTQGHPIDEGVRARLERGGVTVRTDRALRLEGRDGQVAGVALDDGETVPCDAVFFSIAHRTRAELARALGCALTAEGYVRVDPRQQTTEPGVYAAGDITPTDEAALIAAAQGLTAAVAVHESLDSDP